MNVPAGADKMFFAAAIPAEHGVRVIVFDTLVFGSSSSQAFGGALLRGLAVQGPPSPGYNDQIFVDDPLLIVKGELGDAVEKIAYHFLWTAVAGYPAKLVESQWREAN